MPDLQALLEQIDRLDQQATPGPWTIGENDETGLKYFGTGYCDCCTPPIPSAGVILGETGRAEAEFIALARTAMPKLAEAVYQVLELIEVEEKRNQRQPIKFDGAPFPAAVSTSEVRQAILDAMEETLGA